MTRFSEEWLRDVEKLLKCPFLITFVVQNGKIRFLNLTELNAYLEGIVEDNTEHFTKLNYLG